MERPPAGLSDLCDDVLLHFGGHNCGVLLQVRLLFHNDMFIQLK